MTLRNIEIVDCDLKTSESLIITHCGTRLVLENVTFRNNRQMNDSAASMLWFDCEKDGGFLEMTNVTFKSNTAKNSLIATLPPTTMMTNVKVRNNTATTALFDSNQNNNTEIVELVATSNGMTVLKMNEGKLKLKSSTFLENGHEDAIYGVLQLKGLERITVENCNFTRNKASEGGACHFEENENVNITNSMFVKNRAFNDGGAIRSIKVYRMECIQCTFIDNKAKNAGSCFKIDEGTTILKDSVLENNEASFGGTARAERGNFISKNVTYRGTFDSFFRKKFSFAGNLARNTGGACYFDEMNELSVINSTFENNEALYGGALYIQNPDTSLIQNVTLKNNRALQMGGAAHMDKGSITFKDVVVSGNHGALGGGFFFYDVTVDASEFTFEKNEAAEGSAFMARSSTVRIIDNFNDEQNSRKTFGIRATENTATNGGGAIDIERTTLTIGNGNFSKNQAINGGAIHIWNEGELVSIERSKFTNNSVKQNGGSIAASSVREKIFTLKLDDVTFDRSVSSGGGGAIYLSLANLNCVNCSFERCSSFTDGGALWATGERFNYKVSLRKSSLRQCKSESGGGIFVNGTKLDVHNTKLTSNKAILLGGGIRALDSKVTLTGVKLIKNGAFIGGGFYGDGKKVSMTKSVVKKNAAEAGGGVFVRDANINAKDSFFDQNKAKRGYSKQEMLTFLFDFRYSKEFDRPIDIEVEPDGGGLLIEESAQFVGESITFVQNDAENGAGVDIKRTSAFLCFKCAFMDNKAKKKGLTQPKISSFDNVSQAEPFVVYHPVKKEV